MLSSNTGAMYQPFLYAGRCSFCSFCSPGTGPAVQWLSLRRSAAGSPAGAMSRARPLRIIPLLVVVGLVAAGAASSDILIVGSLNIDIIVPIHRLPNKDETITAREPATILAVGGKGANQAVAASRLSPAPRRARFVSRFGNDAHAQMLERELSAHGVDVSACVRTPHLPSGQGIVLLAQDGSASSIVVGGSNTAWDPAEPSTLAPQLLGVGIVLLQREVPEHVNEAYAAAAAAAGVPVLQVGRAVC